MRTHLKNSFDNTNIKLNYYFYIFHLTLSNGKLAITHEGDKGEKGEKFTIHEVISTPYRPQIFYVAPSHVSEHLMNQAKRFR